LTDEPQGHPLDGVWVTLAPGHDLCRAQVAEAERVGVRGLIAAHADLRGDALTGRGAEDSGATSGTEREAEHAASPGLESLTLPLRVDLDPVQLRTRGPALLTDLHALGPDLVGLPLGSTGPTELHSCLRLAEAMGIELVLLLHDPLQAPLAIALAHQSEQVVGFSVSRHDEDAFELLAGREDLGILTAAPEFASAFRGGAGGLEGFPASLSPGAAVWLMGLCHEDVEAALVLERRLLRFMEGHLRPALRRLEASDAAGPPGVLERTLHAAVGGWAPSGLGGGTHHPARLGGGVDPLPLRSRLLHEIPELERFIN